MTFDANSLPAPDGDPTAIVPEVIPPGQKLAPPAATPSRPCPGCVAEGATAHRDELGKIMPGHTFNADGRPKGSKNKTTQLAAEALQGASLLAAQRLIQGVRSDNEWVASACARVIIERTIPPEVLADQDMRGPLLIFPPGTSSVTCTATDAAGNVASTSFKVTIEDPFNKSWPTALELELLPATAAPDLLEASKDQCITTAAQSRWFKFKVQPGSKAIVKLSGLPANYDLVLYKDIGAKFRQLRDLNSAQDLLLLNAEFAAEAFSAEAFSAEAFSATRKRRSASSARLRAVMSRPVPR